MKFYNRDDELAILKRADSLKNSQAIMTVVIGARRVGKTALVLHPFSKEPVLYFFVSRKDEALLCEEFVQEVQNRLDVEIFGKVEKFEDIFAYLLKLSQKRPFTLIIDEFQDFYRVNESIFSTIQKLWDRNRAESKMHLITCGSIYSLMKKIYEDSKEPLFGRADFKIELKPFKVSVIKKILKDYKSYNSKNLLDVYTITGGVAKYIELFALYKSFSLNKSVDEIFNPYSLFLEEGKNRLIEEFGKDYTTYFSILALLASSKTSKREIESILNKNVSGYLYRLESDYSIITSIKPITAKPNSKVQKYEITENFLSFWFRFIYKYSSLIQAEAFDRLKEIVLRDFATYKGRFLEKLFIELLKEQGRYTKIGNYWERGNRNEIDIVAIDEIEKKLLICEVKLSKKRLNLELLIQKSLNLVNKFKGYRVEYKLWSLEDIDNF